MKLPCLFLVFLVAAMTASVTARTAKEAHDLVHEMWKKELAAGGDYSELAKLYAEDVVIDFRAYTPWFTEIQPFYKGRDNIAVWLTAVANNIAAMPRFEITYEFGDGTEKSSIATHHVLGRFKGGGKGFQNFKTYCTYEMNDDGLVSHVGYAIAEHQSLSDLNAQQNHDAAKAAWFRATATGNYGEIATFFADDVKIVWLSGFFDLDENNARSKDVYHGVEEATSWLKSIGPSIADVKSYDTPYTYGMSEDGRNTITSSHMVFKETGTDYYSSAQWYMTWTVNDDGLLSEAIYTFRNKNKVGDGACAADGTCATY